MLTRRSVLRLAALRPLASSAAAAPPPRRPPMRSGRRSSTPRRRKARSSSTTARWATPASAEDRRRLRGEVRHPRSRCWRRAPASCASASAPSRRRARCSATSRTTARRPRSSSSRRARSCRTARCRTRARPVAPFKADGTRVPIYVIAYGILVNTDMVKPAEEPKSWKDLLDPRWKGKILADDMRALGGGAVFFMVTTQTFGRGFHEKLAEQKPHMNRELRGNYRRIARGEYPLYIPFTLPDILDLKGLPVKVDPARPRARPTSASTARSSRARPHPNAARLLIDFFLSDEVQLLYGNLGLRHVDGRARGARSTPEARRVRADQAARHDRSEAAGRDAQAREADLQVGCRHGPGDADGRGRGGQQALRARAGRRRRLARRRRRPARSPCSGPRAAARRRRCG